MASRKLTSEQENWLFLNFPNKTNKELAEELTEMILKENQKKLARLNLLLEEDFSDYPQPLLDRITIASCHCFVPFKCLASTAHSLFSLLSTFGLSVSPLLGLT